MDTFIVRRTIMASTNKQSNKGKGTSTRGFASMDPARQRAIASEGGKAAHERGTAHEFTSEEARRAGSMSHGNRQSANATAKTKADDAQARSDNRQGKDDTKEG
jgi:general stress protein YciG